VHLEMRTQAVDGLRSAGRSVYWTTGSTIAHRACQSTVAGKRTGLQDVTPLFTAGIVGGVDGTRTRGLRRDSHNVLHPTYSHSPTYSGCHARVPRFG